MHEKLICIFRVDLINILLSRSRILGGPLFRQWLCEKAASVRKQPVAWKEYFAEYSSKEIQESMDRCTGRPDITEILLKTAANTIQSINREY